MMYRIVLSAAVAAALALGALGARAEPRVVAPTFDTLRLRDRPTIESCVGPVRGGGESAVTCGAIDAGELSLAYPGQAPVLLDKVLRSGPANVIAFGADPTGVADSTAALTAAIATGKSVYVPAGSYRVTDMLTLQIGQVMYGDGRTTSRIIVGSTFNLSALGVVRLGVAETGATLRDIGLSFGQPASPASRADLIAYPPAIYAVAAPRFRVERVRIEQCRTGVLMTGNSGGATTVLAMCDGAAWRAR